LSNSVVGEIFVVDKSIVIVRSVSALVVSAILVSALVVGADLVGALVVLLW